MIHTTQYIFISGTI